MPSLNLTKKEEGEKAKEKKKEEKEKKKTEEKEKEREKERERMEKGLLSPRRGGSSSSFSGGAAPGTAGAGTTPAKAEVTKRGGEENKKKVEIAAEEPKEHKESLFEKVPITLTPPLTHGYLILSFPFRPSYLLAAQVPRLRISSRVTLKARRARSRASSSFAL